MTLFREKLFPAASLGLWLVFLFLDVTGTADSTGVKFAAICLCCAAALPGARSRDGRLVTAALCFTVAADWFLLVRDDRYTLGVCLFIIVQLLYAYRLYRLRGRATPALLLRLALVVLWLALLIIEPTGAPLWCVALYFLNLCLNTVEAWMLTLKSPQGPPLSRFAWGLLLFVCCDVCVGLWNISIFLPAPLAEFSRVGMWLFYLPSQVLIVLSQRLEGEHV